MIKFICELEEKVWIASWEGDPGRTLVRSSAKTFSKRSAAWKAIEKAQKYRPFEDAKVVVL